MCITCFVNLREHTVINPCACSVFNIGFSFIFQASWNVFQGWKCGIYQVKCTCALHSWICSEWYDFKAGNHRKCMIHIHMIAIMKNYLKLLKLPYTSQSFYESSHEFNELLVWYQPITLALSVELTDSSPASAIKREMGAQCTYSIGRWTKLSLVESIEPKILSNAFSKM